MRENAARLVIDQRERRKAIEDLKKKVQFATNVDEDFESAKNFQKELERLQGLENRSCVLCGEISDSMLSGRRTDAIRLIERTKREFGTSGARK